MLATAIIPISELRKRQAEVLLALERGPAILTQHGKGAAVLLSLEQYNQMLQELEDLEDALDALDSRQDTGAVDFDDYLTGRGERVPAVAEA